MATRAGFPAQVTVWLYSSTEEVARAAAAELTRYPTGGQSFVTDIQHRPAEWGARDWRVRAHAVMPQTNAGKLEQDMRLRFPADAATAFRGPETTPAGKPFPPSDPYADN